MTTIDTQKLPRAAANHRPRPGLGTLAYFGSIVLANMMLIWFAPLFFMGSAVPPAIFLSGFVFVFRDFSQRELGHYVLLAILGAATATYFLAGPQVAVASSTAFLVAELADWALFTWTKRSFSQRVLVSSLLSVPLDTAVFYYFLGILEPETLAIGVIVKLVGTVIFWAYLSRRERQVEVQA